MLKVFYAGVNGLTADAVLHTLSDYRLERLKKTARSEAKAQSLAAELLLHTAQCAAKGNTVFSDFPSFGAVDIHTQDSFFFIFRFA